MHEGCPHVSEGSGSDCLSCCDHLPTPAPLLTAALARHKCSASSLRGPCSASPNLQDEGLESFWPVEIWHGQEGGEEIAGGWHERTRSPWQRFDLSLGGCQACSARGDGVDRLMTGGR